MSRIGWSLCLALLIAGEARAQETAPSNSVVQSLEEMVRVLDQHHLARQHQDHLILRLVPVSMARG